jgi:hypothetical protein
MSVKRGEVARTERELTFEIFLSVLVSDFIRNFFRSLHSCNPRFFRFEFEDPLPDLVQLRSDELAPESKEGRRDFREVKALEMRRYDRQLRVNVREVGFVSCRICRTSEGNELIAIVVSGKGNSSSVDRGYSLDDSLGVLTSGVEDLVLRRFDARSVPFLRRFRIPIDRRSESFLVFSFHLESERSRPSSSTLDGGD